MDTRLLALLAALTAGCAVSRFPDPSRPDVTSYSFHETRLSPAGNSVDDTLNQVTDHALDGTIQNTLDCWAKVAPLTKEERAAAYCDGRPLYGYRGSLSVLVVTDWSISACSGKQLFSCNVPDASCLMKGQTPTKECPCMCRAVIQDDGFIATAPNLELVPWRIIELISGCEQIQKIPRLAQCGSPGLVVGE